MSSIREQIVAALVVALSSGSGAPAGLTIHRERTRPIEIDSLPAILIYSEDDTPTTLGAQTYRAPLSEKKLEPVLELRAAGSSGVAPDQAIDPLYVWAMKAIGADETFGGLANGVEEGKTIWNSREGDTPVAAAQLHITIRYRTSRLDPTSKS